MKKALIFFAICGIASLISCGTPDTKLMSVNAFSPTVWGVWPSGRYTANQRCGIADSLLVDLVRHTIFTPRFTGTDFMYNEYIKCGKKVLLNISFRNGFSKNPEPYPDTAFYRGRIKYLLSSLQTKPWGVVCENEENNIADYYSDGSDPKKYIQILNICIEECDLYNIPCYNGGLANTGIREWWYRHRDKKPFTPKGKRVDLYLNEYATMPTIDAVNIHLYANSILQSKQIDSIVIAIQEYTGKPVITNETGQRVSDNADITKQILSSWRLSAFAIFFSGRNMNEKDPSCPLADSAGNLTEMGAVFRDMQVH